MNRFYVHLQHPDGTTRVLAQEKKKGVLVITTDQPNCHLPPALFTSFEEAGTTAVELLADRKSRVSTFPDYKIIVLEKNI